MSGLKQQARVMDATIESIPEWAPTYRLDQHIARARKEMGEARWGQLNQEWN